MSSDWFRGQAIPRGMPLPRWGRCDSCGAVNVPVRTGILGEPAPCPHTGAVAVETVTTTTHTTEGELRLYTPPTATMRVTALYCPTCRVRIEVGHG